MEPYDWWTGTVRERGDSRSVWEACGAVSVTVLTAGDHRRPPSPVRDLDTVEKVGFMLQLKLFKYQCSLDSENIFLLHKILVYVVWLGTRKKTVSYLE